MDGMTKRGERTPDDVRAKMSAAQKGRPSPFYGRKHTEETKAKMSIAQKGHYMSEETRRKISESQIGRPGSFTGKRHSEKTKAKISAIQKGKPKGPSKLKGRPRDPVAVEKSAAWRRGRPKTAEAKAVLSEAQKSRWESMTEEEQRAFISAPLKGYVTRPTSIEIMVQALLSTLEIKYEAHKKLGRWFVDIYIPASNLIIECDGDYWHSLPKNQDRDIRKTTWLTEHGYNLLRLPECEIRKGGSVILPLIHNAIGRSIA